MSRCQVNVVRAIWISGLLWIGSTAASIADDALRAAAAQALRKSADFFTSKVSTHGGYVYTYSADLSKREGEGKTSLETLWVQPPGTPAVGLAYLEAYERTQAPYLLTSARAAGECLVRGQLRSGGWASSMDFDEAGRRKSVYRVDPERKKLGSNWTTFDDNKTQSALTFLMRLDQVLRFQDATIHEAALFALGSVLKAQYPNGAWPQGYQEFPDPAKFPVKKASYPSEWPRKFPGEKYQGYYTFNDNALADTIEMMFLAARIYQDPKYRDSAIKAGGFILLAQMPEPQPAWAQQYNFDMQPVWARKFEPPSISGGESQGVLRILLSLYRETGDAKFLAPIEPALQYLQRSQLPDGRLARFYELQTNKPLYFTKQYELTYDSSDVPTHYGFIVSSSADRIQRDYEKLRSATPKELENQRLAASRPSTGSAPSDKQVRAVIDSLDERGAWVEDGRLSYHGDSDDTQRVISCRTFIKNIAVLSRYVGASKPGN